jgi:hypothetical protein
VHFVKAGIPGFGLIVPSGLVAGFQRPQNTLQEAPRAVVQHEDSFLQVDLREIEPLPGSDGARILKEWKELTF